MAGSEQRRSSPYQGLIPYNEKDAAFFFGREKETRQIIASLYASGLTLLYGASGVGKSSVLRAGVAHRLRGDDSVLVVVFNSWQGEPVSDLKAAIARAAANVLNSESLPADESSPLAECVATYSLMLKRRMMIILDQFEEYFLYHPQEDAFTEEFSAAVMQSVAPVSFLISLREDTLAKLDRFEGHIPVLFDNYLRIDHLSREAAGDAIEKPLAEYNRLYAAGREEFSIELDLIKALLEIRPGQVLLGDMGRGTVKNDALESRIETPYLQLVLTRIWNEELSVESRSLRLETLNRLGGAANIMRVHLDAAMSSLEHEEQDVAAEIFNYLVTPSGTKIAHSVPDLAKYSKLSQEQVLPVITELSGGKTRILRGVAPSPDRPGTTRYEIFHDVLAPAILDWRARYTQKQELEEAEKQAEKQRQRADDQARTARKMLRLALAIGVLFLVAASAAVYAWTQRTRAQDKAVEAEAAKRDANAALIKAEEERRRAEGQAQLATERETEANEASSMADAQRERAEKQAQLAASRQNEAVKARFKEVASRKQAEAERMRAEEALEELRGRDLADEIGDDLLSSIYSGRMREAVIKFQTMIALVPEDVPPSTKAMLFSMAGNLYESLGERQNALDAYVRARQLYQQVSQKPGEALMLVKIARINFNLGEKRKALEYFKEAHLLKQDIRDSHGEAEVLTEMGEIYLTLRERNMAFESYDQAVKVYRRAGDRSKEAATLDSLGGIANGLDEKLNALEYYNQALSLKRSIGEREGEAATLSSIGRVYKDLGQHRPAIESYEKAVEIDKKSNNRGNAANGLEIIGNTYQYLGNEQKAREYYDQALQLYRELDEPAEEATMLERIGYLYNVSGNGQKAVEYYMDALAVRRGMGKKLWEGAALINLGDIYSQLNDQEQALVSYNQALPLFRSVESSGWEADALNRIGLSYMNLNEGRRAAEHFEQALQGFRREGDRGKEADTLSNLGWAYNILGDKQRSLEYYDQALRAYQERHNRESEANILHYMGAIYKALGQKQKAIDLNDLALKIHRDMRNAFGEISTLITLGRLYEALGNKEKAAEFYQQADLAH